jgi:hypothetical protein
MQSLEEKQQTLQAAIENLYISFSSYKLRTPVEGCSCCVKSADKKRLAAKPLRQLQKDDLSLYAFKAMTTWGDEYDFKHFLPRILELLATGYSVNPGADFLLNKLNYAQWQTWPENERNAIQGFLLALWNFVLDGGETGDGADNWIDNISQVVSDLTPFLGAWEQNNSAEACDLLLEFCAGYDMSPSAPQVIKWLRSDQLLHIFEKRFFEAENEEQADVFSQIVDALTNY